MTPTGGLGTQVGALARTASRLPDLIGDIQREGVRDDLLPFQLTSLRADGNWVKTPHHPIGALLEEPLRDRPGHEVCIVVQGVAPTAEMAEELTITGTRQLFYARLPEVKGTAGGVSFVLDEVMRASPAYRWTLNHTVAVKDGLALFPTHMTEAGI